MMTPTEFMLYAGPVIILIGQEVRAILAARALKRQTEEINDAGQARAQVLQATTVDTAAKLAVHTSDKAHSLSSEMGAIHELVNGNTTALLTKIQVLEQQLANERARAVIHIDIPAKPIETPDKPKD